jgi:hypothetical protein
VWKEQLSKKEGGKSEGDDRANHCIDSFVRLAGASLKELTVRGCINRRYWVTVRLATTEKHTPLTCMWIYDMIDHAMTAAGCPRFPS